MTVRREQTAPPTMVERIDAALQRIKARNRHIFTDLGLEKLKFKIALTLSTPYYEHEHRQHYNDLAISLFGFYVWFRLPPILSYRYVRSERYSNTFYVQRKFGFTMDRTATHIYFGDQNEDRSLAEQEYVIFFYPWRISTVEHYVQSLDGSRQFDYSMEYYAKQRRGEPTTDCWQHWQDVCTKYCNELGLTSLNDRIQAVPPSLQDIFGFGEYYDEYARRPGHYLPPVVARYHIERYVYQRGESKFWRWLLSFTKYSVRELHIEFGQEIGPERGSWKGGTLGCSFKMLPGETAAQAWHRYSTTVKQR